MKQPHSACADPRLIADTLPIIPPNAPIHPKSGPGVPAGRGKIPGKKTAEGWVGMAAWTDHVSTTDDLRIWAGWHAGMGLQGRNFPAVDIDVDDPELSNAIRLHTLDILGDAPTRYGNGARCLLVYAASGMKKRRLTFARRGLGDDAATGPVQAVEFLADGQQYVVEGTHPKTGKPYHWLDDRTPASMGSEGLTKITHTQLDRLLDTLPALLDLFGYEVVSARKPAHPSRPVTGPSSDSSTDEVHRAPSLEAIEAALNAIENSLDYDTWITLSSAVKTAAGPEYEDRAFLMWAKWSLTYPGSSMPVINAKWASFKTPQADWQYLSSFATRNGDGTFHSAQYEFDAVTPAPKDEISGEAQATMPITGMMDRYVWVENLALIADTKTGTLLNREKFNVRNRHIGPPNIKDKCAYTVLTSSINRLQVADALTYRPGADRFVQEDLPGLHGRCVNIWKPTRTALPEGVTDADVQPWLDHLAFVIPNDDERLTVLNWLSWIVQHPGEKPNWALVIGSTAEGIGKDLMLEPVRVALGSDNVREIGPDDIASGYTDFLIGTRLLIVEEMQMHERKAMMNRLKPLIAAPPYTLRVNIKYVPQYEVPNLVAAIFFTNMENALAIGPHDRRYFVTWNDQKPRTAEYYSGLAAWYKEGGSAATAAWLFNRDIADFSPKGAAPASAAKSAMRIATRSLFDEVIEDAISNEDGPFAHPFFTLDEVVNFVQWRIGDRPKISPHRVAGTLRKLGLTQIGRMTLGKPPENCPAPYLTDAREHQVFAVFHEGSSLDSGEVRIAFWASRKCDNVEANPHAMFE